MEECAKRIPQATINQGYGLTESCGLATMTFPKEGNSYFGSVGTLVPGLEAKIISLEKGRPLPPNQRGEVWLHGPCVMTVTVIVAVAMFMVVTVTVAVFMAMGMILIVTMVVEVFAGYVTSHWLQAVWQCSFSKLCLSI